MNYINTKYFWPVWAVVLATFAAYQSTHLKEIRHPIEKTYSPNVNILASNFFTATSIELIVPSTSSWGITISGKPDKPSCYKQMHLTYPTKKEPKGHKYTFYAWVPVTSTEIWKGLKCIK